ncbi:MAG: hypothetical protein E7Z92_04880 [Cyanobacteria bacterium SIG31]|nr:hypothetical protein [Cyanobacteria bacterium SIG31]
MKKMNVIQIKGIKGLIIAGFVVCCLAAGFIVFPGWLSMLTWNYIVSYTPSIPTIGLFQGLLLWGIILAAYFVFRKERVVVCMKSPQGLSEEELKAVFADIKKQSLEDPILQAMLKAREAELKYKAQEKQQTEQDTVANSDSKV